MHIFHRSHPLLALDNGRHLSGHHKGSRSVGEGYTLRGSRSFLVVRGEGRARSGVIQKIVSPSLASLYIFESTKRLHAVKKHSSWFQLFPTMHGANLTVLWVPQDLSTAVDGLMAICSFIGVLMVCSQLHLFVTSLLAEPIPLYMI